MEIMHAWDSDQCKIRVHLWRSDAHRNRDNLRDTSIESEDDEEILVSSFRTVHDREDDGDQSIMEVPTIEMFRYLFMCVIQFTSDIDDQPNASVRNDAEAIQRMEKRFPGWLCIRTGIGVPMPLWRRCSWRSRMVNLGSNEKLSEFFESVYVMIFYRKKIFELSSKKTPRKRDSLCQFSSPLSTSEVSKTATVILSGVMSILRQQKKILLLETSLQKIASPNAWQLENVTDELPRVACGDALSHAGVPVFNRLVSNPRCT